MRTLLGTAAACLLLLTPTPAIAAHDHASVPDGAQGPAQLARQPHWRPVPVDTDQQFRGLDALDRRHAWVGGSDGGVWKTSNGGRSWQDVSPRHTKGLLFRDVEILGPRKVLVLAVGESEASRIYLTRDGGRSWSKTFVNHDDAAFYDCMAMWPGSRRGLAMSDPVDGKFRIIETRNGGKSWSVVDPAGMPDAVDGEFGFAASGTCLVTVGQRDAYLGSGGAASRVFHSSDRGHTWTVEDSTIPGSAAGGVFSLAFEHPGKGIAVGGDFEHPRRGRNMSAFTEDRGRTWTNGGDLEGYRSGVAWLSARRGLAVAVGPTGSDFTRNGGHRWVTFDDTAYDAVQCTADHACWASGPDGAVARLVRR